MADAQRLVVDSERPLAETLVALAREGVRPLLQKQYLAWAMVIRERGASAVR